MEEILRGQFAGELDGNAVAIETGGADKFGGAIEQDARLGAQRRLHLEDIAHAQATDLAQRDLERIPFGADGHRDAIMLAMSLECNFGDCSEQIQIGVPYYTIEPVVKKMQARRQKDTAVTTTAKRAEWQPAYDRITVPVRAEWDAFDLTLREIASLRVGDVLEMRPALCAETRLLLNGTAKFVGTVGLDTDRVAVQLTRKLPPEDSFHAKPDGRKVS